MSRPDSHLNLVPRTNAMDRGRFDVQIVAHAMHIGWHYGEANREAAIAWCRERQTWYTERGYDAPPILEWNGEEWAEVVA